VRVDIADIVVVAWGGAGKVVAKRLVEILVKILVKVDKLVAVVVTCKVVVENNVAVTVTLAPRFNSAALGVTVCVIVDSPDTVVVSGAGAGSVMVK
jgi:hypothetical protein